MKGIILTAGAGTRLYPITKGITKALLPVYDKPMIYYPLSILMEAGINEIMIIADPYHKDSFIKLLGNGSEFGINISYKVQTIPKGVADGFKIAKDFIGNDNCVLTFGDNIFVGNDISNALMEAVENLKNGYSTVFGYEVSDPERFGVMELDQNNNIISLEEKPSVPKSHYAATGLYFYTNSVITKLDNLRLSERGEYEITDINKEFLEEKKLKGIMLEKRSNYWFDTGTIESLFTASDTIRRLQQQNNKIIGALELIGYKKGWIDKNEVLNNVNLKTEYYKYIKTEIGE